MNLTRLVSSMVRAVRQEREAPFLPPEDVVEDESPNVSEEEKVVEELEDTRPFTREELEAARNASNPHRCATLNSFPAPQSGRGS